MSDCATLWTVAHQASLSMGFSRQEYWSGLPCPPPGDLPDPGIELAFLMFPALAGRFFTTSTTWEAQIRHRQQNKGTRNSSGEYFFLQEYKGQNGKEKSISCVFFPSVVKAVSGMTISYRDESRGFLIT